MAKPVKTVDEYVKSLPPPLRKVFEQVRKAVKSAAPKAEELISYRVPFYRYNGHLAALIAFPKHFSLVTMSYDVIKNLKNELKPYKISGTTIKFQPDKPIPSALVRKIIKARLTENDQKAKKPVVKNGADEYMKKLKHPLKKEMEEVRKIIKSANKKISERIKWNAPSYYTSADLVTFNHRNTGAVHLVFHHPAIVKIKSPLLEGNYKDRRMVYFKNMKEVNSNKKELAGIINKLIEYSEK